MTPRKPALVALATAAAVLCTLPTASSGERPDVKDTVDALRTVTQRVGSSLEQTVAKTDEAVRKTVRKTAATSSKQSLRRAAARATASDPPRQPPLHGSNPHSQGGVVVADLDPSTDRPLASDPDGGDSKEEVLVGRSRGEQNANGAYHGHITILALAGSELAGVDTNPGESKNGPLEPVQTGILDPLCKSTNQSVCLSVLTANSATTAGGSVNDFAVARAKVVGLGVEAASSQAAISNDSNCQTAIGTARTANISTTGGPVAQVANSSSSSKSCRGAAPVVTNTSQVIGLGGTGVALPAAGCADGAPDTVAGLPPLVTLVCNADEIAGAAAVREALDVFVLQTGTTSLAKETTGAAESFTVAPAGPETPGSPQCSDKVDNDQDGKIDAADPGCHTDNKADNNNSYDPADNDETDKRDDGGPGPGPGDGDDGGPVDEDGGDDGGGGGGGGAGGGGDGGGGGELPFTGSEIIGVALAGLLMLAGGLLLRRREDPVIGR
jgi:LPXTG-motif cell wall-anchored protein